jgi:phytoene synthase
MQRPANTGDTGAARGRADADAAGLGYCGQQVRAHDPDRFLASLFAPADRRPALFALYAFNLEVAKTAEVVSEPMLGQIRLQWWREALDEAYAGRARKHQVAEPLAEAIRVHDLPRDELEALIDARERDLDPAPPPDLASLERYADDTSAGLQRLALRVLGTAGEAETAAATQVGIAWALVGLLRAVPFHAARKRLYLPEDHLTVAGVDRQALFELKGSDALSGVAMRLARRAEERLGEARRRRGAVAAKALPALLPARLADLYLRRLAGADYDPFDPRVGRTPGNRAAILWWAAFRRRY